MNQEYYKDTNEFLLEGVNDKAILLIHGFTSSPADMKGIGDYLNSKGFTILACRLAGHGTNKDDLKNSSYEDWLKSAEEAYLKLQDKYKHIYIAGHSLGGLIAIHLALKYETEKMALLAPAFREDSSATRILNFTYHFYKNYKMYDENSVNPFKPPYTIVSYPYIYTKSIYDLYKLIKNTYRLKWNKNIPIKIFYGQKDSHVSIDGIKKGMKLLNLSKDNLIIYPQSTHALIVDDYREKVWDDVYNFFNLKVPINQDLK